MAYSNWYLIAYDISHQRRMQRVHRLLKKRAIPVQKSVFFFKGHEGQMKKLLDEISALMNLKEDDLRAWPVDRISSAWMYGENVQSESIHIVQFQPWWKRWLKRWVA